MNFHFGGGFGAVAVAGAHDVVCTESGGGSEEDPGDCNISWGAFSTILGRPRALKLFWSPTAPTLRGKMGNDTPLKRPKHNGGHHAITHVPVAQDQIAVEHGQRNKPSEPKQHCQCIESQDGELVRETWEVGRREGEIWDCDDHGPDGAEKEEADGVGGEVDAGMTVVPVCHLETESAWNSGGFLGRGRPTVGSETENDETEEPLEGTDGEYQINHLGRW